MTRQLNAVATPACPYGSVQRDDAGFLRTNQTLLWYPTPQRAIAEASKMPRGMVVIDPHELELLYRAAERLRELEAAAAPKVADANPA